MINIPSILQNEEYRFVLLKPKDKKPFEDDWQNNGYRYDDYTIKEHIQNGGNYGVIGGYGNLRILDIDIPEIADKLIQVLETFTVRSGSGGAHFYFKSEYEKNQVLPNGAGELRCNKYQVVGPSCIHPNGNMYIIIKNIPIMNITIQELEKLIIPYIPMEIKQEQKNIDTSRSGQEFGKLIKLIKQGMKKDKLDKDYIFNEMNFYSKWKEGTQSYREHTWKKAIEHIKEKKSKEENKQEIHTTAGIIRVDQVKENAEKLYMKIPYHYDTAKIFWVWNTAEYCWEMRDEIDLMNLIENSFQLNGLTINSKIKNEYIEAFKRIGRLRTPKTPPPEWIQFKGKIFDITTKTTFAATHKYFFCNPIPWELGTNTETPTIDKLFTQWVGIKHAETLYEFIAYCCYTNYPIHVLICAVGSGSNGKTKYINLIEKFIGQQNTCSIELDETVDNRFAISKLYKKLLCTMGETNFETMRKTSKIKKLTGQDTVSFEFKGKEPIDEKNYAKIVIATNTLPLSEDTSDGFYRRWLIIDFPNTFTEGKDILNTIPEQEFRALAKKITDILPKLLERGHFINQGSVEQRKKRYIEVSNPFSTFVKQYCNEDTNKRIKYSELYNAYSHFCTENKKRIISRRAFSDTLGHEGYEIEKTSVRIENEVVNSRFVMGLELRPDWREKKEKSDSSAQSDRGSTLFSYVRNEAHPLSQMEHRAQNESNSHTDLVKTILNLLDSEKTISTFEISEQIHLKADDVFRILEYLSQKGEIFQPSPDKWKKL